MRSYPLGRYGLAIVLALMFFGSWAGQYHFQWQEFKEHAKEHRQPAVRSEFHQEFWARTFENWQSEFLQVLAFAVLTKYLVLQGSPQSRDGDDEMKAQLDRIESRLP